MKTAILFAVLLATSSASHATSWTYQGTLNDMGQPANGSYDLRLTLFDANGTRALAAPITLYGVVVQKGSFSADIDFGVDLSTQRDLKLNTEVQQGGSGFVSLGELTAADPDGGAVCWGTSGNSGVASAIVGTNAVTDDGLLALRSQGDNILYLRGANGGVEQNTSLATGLGSAAWNASNATAPNSFTVGNGSAASAANNSFVYADGTGSVGTFVSNLANQFLVRADGGMMLNTSAAPFLGDDFTIGARPVSGDADADLSWITRSGKKGRIFLSDSSGKFDLSVFDLTGSDFLTTNANGAKLTTGGAWTNGSSRNFKQDFVAVDVLDVLNKVTKLPISTWTYKNSPEGTHVGPMAEDFKAAFDLGSDAQHIATIDADGVALAAIQGLHQKLQTENTALRDQNAALLKRLEAIEQRIAQGVSVAPNMPVHSQASSLSSYFSANTPPSPVQ